MVTDQNLIRIFEYALNQEETGKSFFQNSIQRMGIGAAVSAFRQLIEEEEKHIAFIGRILNNLREGKSLGTSDLAGIAIEPKDYFDQRAKTEFLKQCLESSMIPDVTVFNVAWMIERDLSEFYGKMAMKTDGEARDALLMLSQWEEGHERFFREYRDKISDIYSQMPWGA